MVAVDGRLEQMGTACMQQESYTCAGSRGSCSGFGREGDTMREYYSWQKNAKMPLWKAVKTCGCFHSA